jgi:hypothetical protein
MSEFHRLTEPVAAKEHNCDECRGLIRVGEQYVRCCGKSEGYMYDLVYCEVCYGIWTEAAHAFDWLGEDAPMTGELRAALSREHGISDAEAWAAAKRDEAERAEQKKLAPPWLEADLAALVAARR